MYCIDFSYLSAAFGVILVAGSHSRHLLMKSKKSGSSQPLSAVCSSLEPGGPRGFPLRDLPPFRTVVPSGSVVAVQYLGYPFELMKFFALFELSTSFPGGIPSSSMMQLSWSPSSSPGRRGYPVSSSAKMQPRLHMSSRE